MTGEEVKAAMIASDIKHVDHHDCAICGEMVFYSRKGENLFFNSGCGCAWSPEQPRSWDDPADWINMQRTPEVRNRLRALFGLPLEEVKA